MAPFYSERSQNLHDHFNDYNCYNNNYSYAESIKELDRKLARVRNTPSQVK